jgi:aminoglycoside phosphotransferase (APT) family kinase protein
MIDTIDVRPGEELDAPRLEAYLRANLPGAEGEFGLRQFGGGHANLTYLVRFGEREFVLRRPPHGPLPAGGHDMKREYRVLSELWKAFPLAPRAFLLCTDHDVLGVDFVVMERRNGVVIRRELPPQLMDDHAAQRRLGENFIDALAALHNVDYVASGLSELGKPDGYLQRQMDGWIKRWYAAETNDRPAAEDVIAWLTAHQPVQSGSSVIHNDYKLDNTIVDERDLQTFVAVLDWDMSTLGDPLSDLGNVLALWVEPNDPPSLQHSTMPIVGPGFPTRREIVERYAAKTGRDVTHVGWYRAFNVFRYAVIDQQIYVRYRRGQTHDDRFKDLGFVVSQLIESARTLVTAGARLT